MRKLFYLIPYILCILFLYNKTIFSQTDWMQYNTGAPLNIPNISVVNENVAYITGYAIAPSGFFFKKTSNGGINWYNVEGAHSSRTQYMTFINENTGWVFATDSYIEKTTNGGQNWVAQLVPNVYIFLSSYGYFINENTGWALCSSISTPNHEYIIKTTNGGTNWVIVYDDPGEVKSKIYFVNETTGWCLGNSNLYKSTNGGSNWVINNPGAFNKIFFTNENTGWLCSSIIQKTTNGGANWNTQLNSSGFPIRDIFFSDQNTGYAVGSSGVTPGNGRILKTTNSGETWIKNYLDTGYFKYVKFLNDNTGFVCCENNAILKTTNAGGGLTGIVFNNNEIIPGNFSLQQNYPNPFNPSTIIKYSIPGNGAFVNLTIYDIYGRQLKTLVQSYKNAGSYDVEFNSEGFASGIYFYKLDVGDKFSEVKKMIVLK